MIDGDLRDIVHSYDTAQRSREQYARDREFRKSISRVFAGLDRVEGQAARTRRRRRQIAGHVTLLGITGWVVFGFVPILAAYVHASDHVAFLDPLHMVALWVFSYAAILGIGLALSLINTGASA